MFVNLKINGTENKISDIIHTLLFCFVFFMKQLKFQPYLYNKDLSLINETNIIFKYFLLLII